MYFRGPNFSEFLDLLSQFKRGDVDGVRVRIGKLQVSMETIYCVYYQFSEFEMKAFYILTNAECYHSYHCVSSLVMIVWQLDLQLPMQLVSIITNVSSNPTHGEVYSIQHYVIKFYSNFWQVSGFLRIHQFSPPPIKLIESGVKHHKSNPHCVFIHCIVLP